MDRIKETANIIKKINKYKHDSIEAYELIKEVCHYFDNIKDCELNPSDLKFLKYLSSIVGIPHYFDLLSKFKNDNLEINNIDMITFSSLFYESTLYTDDLIKLHRYQKEVLQLFENDKLNRYFLSASTSFGKTFLVYEIIKKMNYNNVVLIFPTIALLTENLEKIFSRSDFQQFREMYNIHTISEIDNIEGKNIFIYTPERFLSFLDQNNNINFDFIFVDEVYKMDNEYIIDNLSSENERDVAYRLALYYIMKKSKDVLLAGPYIEFANQNNLEYNPSFDNFIFDNNFKTIDYNNYDIVNKIYSEIKDKKRVFIDDNLIVKFNSTNKKYKFVSIVDAILNIKENCIVYCSYRHLTEEYAKKLIQYSSCIRDMSIVDELLISFIKHLNKEFDRNWIVIKALKYGIGIHHGLVPKYIQKEIINLFNKGIINTLISTTTITEGVNTSAKNLIVLHDKKGRKSLQKFDAKNIAGRAGRFNHHYSGRIIVIKNKFIESINSEGNGIKHKNYDKNSNKDEIDIFITNEKYLNNEDESRKRDIDEKIKARQLPDDVLHRYKVVSISDKIKVFDRINQLDINTYSKIKNLIGQINFNTNINFDGFQTVLDIIEPIVKNKDLKFMISYKIKSKNDKQEYSLLTYSIYYYLRDGFKGCLQYHLSSRQKNINEAMRETSKFVYNTIKYHLVKYLGVFNIMYMFIESLRTNKSIEEVVGINKLLKKLEYNALTDKGKLASDYGVPTRIIDYFEKPHLSDDIYNSFDNYEKVVFEKVNKLL